MQWFCFFLFISISYMKSSIFILTITNFKCSMVDFSQSSMEGRVLFGSFRPRINELNRCRALEGCAYGTICEAPLTVAKVNKLPYSVCQPPTCLTTQTVDYTHHLRCWKERIRYYITCPLWNQAPYGTVILNPMSWASSRTRVLEPSNGTTESWSPLQSK